MIIKKELLFYLKTIQFIALILAVCNGFAQQHYLYYSHQNYFKQSADLNSISSNVHTSFKPLLYSKIDTSLKTEPIYYPLHSSYSVTASKFINWLFTKTFKESFVRADSSSFFIEVDPVLDVGITRSSDTLNNTYTFGRGARIRGQINDKLYFQTVFVETQASFPRYINTRIDQAQEGLKVTPGQGIIKRSANTISSDRDFSLSSGYISYSPNTHFNFTIGQGKHFIGNGYRSLLLSDNSFNYPYFKITTEFGKFQYTNLYTSFINITDLSINDEGFFHKRGMFNYLSFNASKRLNIGLFEATLLSDNFKQIDLNFINPLILTRTFQYGFANTNNVMLGLNLKYKLLETIQLYSQLALDDFSKTKNALKNKMGFQIGVRAHNVFTPNLDLVVEYNKVRPYVYSHTDSLQSYTHLGQNIVHPLGANFDEIVGIVNYRYKNWTGMVKLNYANQGLDSLSLNFGGNAFLSNNNVVNQNGSVFLGGNRVTVINLDFNSSYLLNPHTDLILFAGYKNRILNSEVGRVNKDAYFYIGIKTNINNFYTDF